MTIQAIVSSASGIRIAGLTAIVPRLHRQREWSSQRPGGLEIRQLVAVGRLQPAPTRRFTSTGATGPRSTSSAGHSIRCLPKRLRMVLGRATGPGNHAASETLRKTVLPRLNVRLMYTRLGTLSSPDLLANLTAMQIPAPLAHWRPW